MFTILKAQIRRALRSFGITRSTPTRRPGFVALRIECLEARFAPAVYTWDAQNPQGGNWNDAANWMGNVVPGQNDTASFANSNNNPCMVNGDFTVGRLELTPGYSGTITLQGNLTVATEFTQSSGTVTGGGSLTVTSGNGLWEGGTIGGSGDPDTSLLIIPQQMAGTTFKIKGNVALDGRSIQNSGVIEWNDNIGIGELNSTITASFGGSIINLAGGTFQAPGIAGMNSFTGQGVFLNSGTVDCQAGATINFGVPVTSYQGTIVVAGAASFSNLTLLGGDLAGTGVITVSGSSAVSGNASTAVADLRLYGVSTISADFTIAGGNVRLYSPTTITGSVDLNAGLLKCMAPVTVSGANASINAPAGGGRLVIRNGLTVIDGTVSNANANDMRWQGGDIDLQGNGQLINTGTLRIIEPDPGDTLPGEPAPLPVGTMTGDGLFTNSSFVRVFTVVAISADFENSGTIFLHAGVLMINHAWSQSGTVWLMLGHLQVAGDFINDGTVRASENSQILVGTLINNGTIDLASAEATVDLILGPSVLGGGRFVQSANGRLLLKITGNNNSCDRLIAADMATLDGTLRVTVPEGVNLNPNQIWTLLSASATQQQFAVVEKPPEFANPVYNQQTVTISN